MAARCGKWRSESGRFSESRCRLKDGGFRQPTAVHFR